MAAAAAAACEDERRCRDAMMCVQRTNAVTDYDPLW